MAPDLGCRPVPQVSKGNEGGGDGAETLTARSTDNLKLVEGVRVFVAGYAPIGVSPSNS